MFPTPAQLRLLRKGHFIGAIMKTTIFSKAIPSVLFIAGAIDKATFSGVEIFRAMKQYAHGDVVPVLDTLSILTHGKFEPQRNKNGAVNLRANVTPFTLGAKSNFKKLGAVLALLDLTENDACEENGMLFCELAKQYSAELKQAYEATKTAKTSAVPSLPTTVTESNPIDGTISNTVEIDVITAFDATLQAIQAGLLDASQLTQLRMLLAELPTIEASHLAVTH